MFRVLSPKIARRLLTARILPLLFALWIVFPSGVYGQSPQARYDSLQARLGRGWNTWNTESVLSHVHLPEGFALSIHLKDTRITGERYLRDAYISQKQKRPETIIPGPHAWDGSYTALTLQWNDSKLRVESATDGQDLVLLVTPLKLAKRAPHLVLQSGILWNRPGQIARQGEKLVADFAGAATITVGSTQPVIKEMVAASAPYLSFSLQAPVGIYTGKARSLEEIRLIIARQQEAHQKRAIAYRALSETYGAIQGVVAWNTIYDPVRGKVLTPVSRFWNTFFGGNSVLFCWDTYFGALLAAIDNKDLASANAVEVTRGVRQYGMVPNYVGDVGLGSPDRSQPPVGSIVVGEIYRKYGEKWLPELLFDDLLTWNRWWPTHRSRNNLLHWGSDSLPPPYNDDASNAWQGAAYESGLDNSPMFDGVPFNKKTHLMEQADVGLTSLYIADCNALAELALVIGRKKEATELKKRSARYAAALRGLWDEEKGIFLNRRTDTGKPNPRISPTNFYPMLAGVATPAQAARMMKEHYFNPQEFYGDWVMPSVPRNDPAYAEQNYWRGRIWGPLNFLVYLGMRKYDLPEARKDLARRSDELLLNTFRRTGMVHENYNAVTGNGLDAADPPNRSDSFYHWGGLLGLPALFEGGFLGQPTDTGKHRK
jgi:hypothetical protein